MANRIIIFSGHHYQAYILFRSVLFYEKSDTGEIFVEEKMQDVYGKILIARQELKLNKK